MSDVFLFLAFGLVCLFLLLLWAQRSAETAAGRRETFEPNEVLGAFQLELPVRAFYERIFATEDWNFVSQQALPRVQRQFLADRKAVALAWLRRTRENAGRVMHLHLLAVRGNTSLKPLVEFRLAIHYLVFLLVYDVLRCLIWLRGPFKVT